MSEEEHSNKRQRLLGLEGDDEANPPTRAAAATEEDHQEQGDQLGAEARSAAGADGFIHLLSEDLPSCGVYRKVLSFLDFSERQALTLVNRRGLREVESYSEKVYKAIKSRHGVDETFDERVGDQSNLQTPITQREKPVDIPWRYRVCGALQKYLYKIPLAHDFNFIVEFTFSISPSGKLFAISTCHPNPTAAQTDSVYAFIDLSTRRVCSMKRENRTTTYPVPIGDDQIVYLDYRTRNIIIWTKEVETASWTEKIVIQETDYEPKSLRARDGDQFFFFKTDPTSAPPRLISYTKNVNDGSEKTNFAIEINSSISSCYFAKDGNRRWLIFVSSRRDLFIYDLVSNERSQFLPDSELVNMTQSSDCSTTFFSVRGWRTVLVWNLGEDGRLSESSRFLVEGERIQIVAATKNCVLVKICNGNDNVVKCYDANSGKLKQSFGRCVNSVNSAIISNSRKEMLYAFPDENPEGNKVTSVRAYCFEEPQL